ncbi:MAG: MbcA/ParS/Xre antitoxin family protein [Candidatus Puniceispirillales bacterium WSBS_2018_MAG_OTU23]
MKALMIEKGTPENVVAKAMLNAADLLLIERPVLEKTIGISESTLRRVERNQIMPANPKSTELALLFIRLFRSLDAIVGGEANTAQNWMHNENSALLGRPVDLIQTVTGLVNVIAYLDSRRAIV